MVSSHKNNLIVIGNGMVGYKFLEKLVSKGLHSRYNVIAFGEEPHVAYDRVHLSEYFTNPSSESLQMAPRDWYVENNITLHTGDPVVDVNTANKKVVSHKGLSFNYDKLVFLQQAHPLLCLQSMA